MRWIGGGIVGLALVSGGAGAGYWYAVSQVTPPANSRPIAYYQDPAGKPDYSPVPKKDAEGRDYVPVHEQAAGAAPAAALPARETGGRKVLYYRNPMGLSDTSPVPKKDSMGMAYLPVYAGPGGDDGGTVTISPGKIQTLGVRTELVTTRIVARTIRAAGTVQFDERRLAVVNPKFEGWIEKLNVNTTGQAVRRGEPLLEVYSPDLVAAQQEYLIARDAMAHMGGADAAARAGASSLRDASLARLRNWDIPAVEVEQLARTGKVLRTLTLRAPIDGVVTEKTAVAGMRFAPGDTLFRIADLSKVWLIANVFEQDLASVQIGASARVTVGSWADRAFTGTVAFIYPAMTRETRTAQVRIELMNPGALLKPDMYGQAEIGAASDAIPVVTVPDSAVIDGGTTQTVLIEQGEGRYQPRRVKLGQRGDGYVEVMDGVRPGEKVVVGANFLIDAESNLRAALQSFSQGTGTQGKDSKP
ncbi:MAG: efflux RND transporter periplasmic adaptor subunit [Acetobacteraceae bacterium]|nr:efflux RND transporter periplasmic adaptor subunit [Acetobacteraceae bacterium]